jgi:ABC-2 type transport system permease protein
VIDVRGYLALTGSELRLFLREPFAVVFVLVFPIMMMLLLAAVFGNDPAEAQEMEDGMLIWRGVVPTDYYTAASVAVVVAALGLMTLPIQLAGYREQGILRRLEASSVPAWTVLGAQLTVALVTVCAGALVMAVSSWLIYDSMLPDDLLGVVVAVGLGTVSFSALGALLATLIRTSRAAQGIGLLLFFGMWLIAGTAPPRAVLPAGLRDFGEVIPLTHLVLAIQDPWYGFGWRMTDLAILAGVAIIAAIPAIWFFRRD